MVTTRAGVPDLFVVFNIHLIFCRLHSHLYRRVYSYAIACQPVVPLDERSDRRNAASPSDKANKDWQEELMSAYRHIDQTAFHLSDREIVDSATYALPSSPLTRLHRWHCTYITSHYSIDSCTKNAMSRYTGRLSFRFWPRFYRCLILYYYTLHTHLFNTLYSYLYTSVRIFT